MGYDPSKIRNAKWRWYHTVILLIILAVVGFFIFIAILFLRADAQMNNPNDAVLAWALARLK
jgi:hypothetical protein